AGATTASATFTAPTLAAGAASVTLHFTFSANNGTLTTTATTTVTVLAPVAAPIATAGAPQTVQSGAAVTLAGTASDPNTSARCRARRRDDRISDVHSADAGGGCGVSDAALHVQREQRHVDDDRHDDGDGAGAGGGADRERGRTADGAVGRGGGAGRHDERSEHVGAMPSSPARRPHLRRSQRRRWRRVRRQ